MLARSPRCRSRWVLVLALLVAAVGLWRGLELTPDLATRLRDDAYYEFVWAANVAAGLGPTVSDGVTTSGVQLLWSVLLVPCAWLFGAAALPVVAPWCGFGLHLLAAALWWRSGRDRVTARVVALAWLGHPLLLRECQNGQESALAALLATALWLGRRGRERGFVALAIAGVLARSDLAALVVALSLWRHAEAWWRGLWAPACALAVHGGLNLWLGGGVLPDSALPMAWLWHANQALVDPSWSAWAERAWWFARPALLGGPFALASVFGIGLLVYRLVRPWWPAAWRVLPALLVGVASGLGGRDLATPGCVALLLAMAPAPARRRLPTDLLAACVGLGSIIVVHWALRWYPRDYYVAPLVVAALAAVASVGRSRGLLAAFLLAQLVDAARVLPEPLAGQRELAFAGQHLAAVLPPGARVGCFNSGIVTFYAATTAPPGTALRIVNLDGVVDARSFAALQQGELGASLASRGIDYVIDHPVQFATDPALPHACGHWFGAGFDPGRDLVEVACFDDPLLDHGRPLADCLRLYRLARAGPAPTHGLLQPRWLGRDLDGVHAIAWPGRRGDHVERVGADGQAQRLRTLDADSVLFLRVAGDGVVRGRGSDTTTLRLPAADH